ncbi:MAG: CPBP family intramembrane metalloprotease [Oscillospiraceae bacterium]|jgi:membrane protease YdiL (CAAX protease family)|nr:CPBP family intramembrane metalloprotease [Oscillospiraceae bacterium]
MNKEIDFNDYKKTTYMVFFAIYFIIDIIISVFSTNPMRLTFIIQTPMLFIALFLFRKLLINDIKLFKDNKKRYTLFIIIGLVCLMFFNILGSNISYWILGDATLPNQEATEFAFAQTPFLGFFVIAFAAPFLEELMYRRAIKVIIKNKALYYIISALLFGFAHITIGFTFPVSFAFIFTHTLVGLCLAFIYDKTKNIWCPIFIHLLNNGFGAIIMLVSM